MTATTDLSEDPSTTTHGFPRQLHRLLAESLIIEYKSSNPDANVSLTEREQNFEYHTRVGLTSLKDFNLDREIIGKLPHASDRGNEGANF